MNIGLISAATYRHGDQPMRPGSHHGTAFAATFNGFDEEVVKQHEWTFVRAKKRIEGHKVVKVWDQDKVWAQRLADACSIPEVCDTAEECSTGVDLAIIVDDGSAEQWRYAEHPLKNGIPTFCDKPLAMTAKQAKAIADLAEKTGTPFMSASSLRFVPDILKLRDEVESVGPVNLAQAICGNELLYYGIHALSMIYAVLGDGGGAVSVHNVGQPGMNVVRIRYADHRDVVLLVGDRDWMRSGYQISLYGKKGWKTVTPNLENLYTHLLEEFLNYVKTGETAATIQQEVDVIAVLEAGERSLKEGREVMIEEVFQ